MGELKFTLEFSGKNRKELYLPSTRKIRKVEIDDISGMINDDSMTIFIVCEKELDRNKLIFTVDGDSKNWKNLKIETTVIF